MAEKKTIAETGSKSTTSAPFEETPWAAHDRTLSEPDAATEAAMLLLSEAAHYSFRLEPLSASGILVSRAGAEVA